MRTKQPHSVHARIWPPGSRDLRISDGCVQGLCLKRPGAGGCIQSLASAFCRPRAAAPQNSLRPALAAGPHAAYLLMSYEVGSPPVGPSENTMIE